MPPKCAIHNIHWVDGRCQACAAAPATPERRACEWLREHFPGRAWADYDPVVLDLARREREAVERLKPIFAALKQKAAEQCSEWPPCEEDDCAPCYLMNEIESAWSSLVGEPEAPK